MANINHLRLCLAAAESLVKAYSFTITKEILLIDIKTALDNEQYVEADVLLVKFREMVGDLDEDYIRQSWELSDCLKTQCVNSTRIYNDTL